MEYYPRLAGRGALLLLLYGLPHGMLLIGVSGTPIERREFFQCYSALRIQAPLAWKISESIALRKGSGNDELVDASGDVSIRARMINLISFSDALSFAGPDPTLRLVIENGGY